MAMPSEFHGQLLMPDEDTKFLSKRYNPSKIKQAGIYPEVTLGRKKEGALQHPLDDHARLVSFYEVAASKGHAVILSIQ